MVLQSSLNCCFNKWGRPEAWTTSAGSFWIQGAAVLLYSHLLSTAKSSHHSERPHFGHLYHQPSSIAHFPKMIAIGDSWDTVAWAHRELCIRFLQHFTIVGRYDVCNTEKCPLNCLSMSSFIFPSLVSKPLSKTLKLFRLWRQLSLLSTRAIHHFPEEPWPQVSDHWRMKPIEPQYLQKAEAQSLRLRAGHTPAPSSAPRPVLENHNHYWRQRAALAESNARRLNAWLNAENAL